MVSIAQVLFEESLKSWADLTLGNHGISWYSPAGNSWYIDSCI